MLRTTITADKLPVYLSSLAAGVLLSTLPQLEAQALNINFTGTLEGSQEVPPVMTPATGFATGNLMGDFGSNNFVFTYEITYSDLTAPIAPIGVTGGHLHNAPFGDTGSISHILDTDFFNYTGTQAGTIMGDWRFDDPDRPLTEALAQELIDGDIYINLHTGNFGSGEIRAQLTAVPESSPILGMGLALGLVWCVSKCKNSNSNK